jgi:hypothetical protein
VWRIPFSETRLWSRAIAVKLLRRYIIPKEPNHGGKYCIWCNGNATIIIEVTSEEFWIQEGMKTHVR